MKKPTNSNRTKKLMVLVLWILVISGAWIWQIIFSGPVMGEDLKSQQRFEKSVKPIIAKYCLECHSTKSKKGSLDLERFATISDVRKDVKPWQNLIEQIETGEMPPKEKPQPTELDKKEILDWVKGFLEAEARARTGDPGKASLRRLSNAEYDATIRDLTGIDLKPTREFPVDGAGGEGFTNAGESLSDISPALFSRYLQASKEIADHAVLLPDGFRFSPSKTRRDWSDEAKDNLRKMYAKIWPVQDGGFAPLIGQYIRATVLQREALSQGQFNEVALKNGLNSKYLQTLWMALNDNTASEPMDIIRSKWRKATEKEVDEIVNEVKAWQTVLWRTGPIGSYVRSTDGKHTQSNSLIESLSRQLPIDNPIADNATIRLPVKVAPGQTEVTIYLAALEPENPGKITWHKPRIEGNGKQFLLRDYASFGPAFEIDIPTIFKDTSKYLSAVAEFTHATNTPIETIAKKNELDEIFLRQWIKALALTPLKEPSPSVPVGAILTLLDKKTDPGFEGAIKGWAKSGSDLPIVVANSSEKTLSIPGRISPHSVAVHPTPQEYVAVVWNSPITGEVSVVTRISHAHNCGNGVAWHLEHRQGNRASLISEGNLDVLQTTNPFVNKLKVEKGDQIVLALDPRNRNHSCDLTEVDFKVTMDQGEKRVWDLNKDVSKDIQKSNPHADNQGNAGTWSFARGESRKSGPEKQQSFLAGSSMIGRWRSAASVAGRRDEAEQLGKEVEKILTGPRPSEKNVEREMYDKLVALDSPVFAGIDITKLSKSKINGSFGLSKDSFSQPDGESITESTKKVVEIKLPASLFIGREFVVDAKIDNPQESRYLRVRAATTPPEAATLWNGPILGSTNGTAHKRILAGNNLFRNLFPLFTCFPGVVPTDEVVSLKMFHREDEPLLKLFASEEQARELERMWAELRLVSRQPVAEYDYLPQLMAYTTQDTSKAFQQFFIERKPKFKKEADDFQKWEEEIIPVQEVALLKFAEKAFRRPLQDNEKTGLKSLYEAIRKKGADHNEAFRGVLARILTSPSFLFRTESSPPGKQPAPVSDWELATRLSYFLWSSMPDEDLRKAAASGKIHESEVLAEQAKRMLKSPNTRSLAIEFGTQWIHVRGFDELKEKNEKLFPTFDAKLREAIYEESILFFQDLFQNDRPVQGLLDGDYTFLNETLAKHYGIPNVLGSNWRKVEGVKKYGRGGILGLASVHSRQSGASRTSPVLRGNWVVETLLGEKLPRPPANVPVLPDQESTDKLTTRQMVEKHVSNASCATCHVRIDPFGFAFEKFDPIGRVREKESGGQPVDTKAKLKDGTEFEGVEGLRAYLLAKKKDVVLRQFCQKLLGYALGRGTTLSDTLLIDEMMQEMKKNEGRVSSAVMTIIQSPQFRMVRGRDSVSLD